MIPLLGLSVRLVWDHISLYEDIDVEFNSLSEDHQDLADKFPKKTDEVLIGNRLRSPIVMEC